MEFGIFGVYRIRGAVSSSTLDFIPINEGREREAAEEPALATLF